MKERDLLSLVRKASPANWATGAIVALSTFYLLWIVNPNGVLFTSTLPTGGDLGAHVWGPAFIRDELIPRFRLTGWTPDWYAGFPAYHFYMIVPMLFIVALNVGLILPLAIPLAVLAIVALVLLFQHRPFAWIPTIGVLVVATILIVPIHYGIAIKLVAVAGLVFMPISAWLMGRLSGLPFPAPALMAAATLPFIFDRSFNIFGGNLMSTMAGEFAYALAVSFCLVYIGVLMRGMDTGKGRAWAALLLTLTGLCHLLVAFYALVVTLLVILFQPSKQRIQWIVTTGITSALLSAFWVLPFWWQRDHLNDMAWDKLPRFKSYLWDRSELAADFLTNSPPFQVVLVLAGIGFIFSVVFRRRLGIVLGASLVVLALAFIHLPEGRLYNGRILPAYYLGAYLLAAIGVAESFRTIGMLIEGVSGRVRKIGKVFPYLGSITSVFLLIILLGLPLRSLPGGTTTGNTYKWMGFETEELNLGRGWVNWNFSGYEGRIGDVNGGGWEEHRALVNTMEEVSKTYGCGRLMWEYNRDLVRYGTPMALMLMPHWTDGCIGSMEGLYFEASTTTPYHFLMQSELSMEPSRAQRGLPYRSFNLGEGVNHLQQFGVTYYAAFSERPVVEARRHPALTEIAVSGPWTIFLVENSPLVEPLTVEPAVWTDVEHSNWLDHSVEVFNDSSQSVTRLLGGLEGWQQIETDQIPEARKLKEIEVTEVVAGVDRVSFTVNEVGVPVVVKVSYFPNWEVEGAEGPWRATPNLMVVVPTEEQVILTYGRTGIDIFSIFLTLLGLVFLLKLRFQPSIEISDHKESQVDGLLKKWAKGDEEEASFEEIESPPE